ncbi:MAG: hypothetical protein WD801_09155 [Gemmatimonadaceae bacterium]
MGLFALAACGRDPAAHADTTPDSTNSNVGGMTRRDSAAGYVTESQDPVRPRDSSRAARTKDSARTAGDTIPDPAADSTAPALNVTMAPGRFKRDSLSLIYTLRAANKHPGWPVKGPAPAPGALLPNKRIVAYYGNPLSKRMGILGEIPPDQMLARLEAVAKEWEEADPETPVQLALHLVAVVAQGAAGKDGKYRLRMDSSLIEKVYGWAQQKNALLFLDLQMGQSTVQEELPRLMKWLERPDVHLGLDPEFNMHHDKAGVAPGKKIGTLAASEINHAISELSALARAKGIPPKVLVIHRFTRPMVRNASQIKLDPYVQVVIDMDGWGAPWLKFDSYKDYVVNEPVQFAGFKIFYKNDTKKGDKILTPGELLQLKPTPMYIQYQ